MVFESDFLRIEIIYSDCVFCNFSKVYQKDW